MSADQFNFSIKGLMKIESPRAAGEVCKPLMEVDFSLSGVMKIQSPNADQHPYDVKTVYLQYLFHPCGTDLEVELSGSIRGGYFSGFGPTGAFTSLSWDESKSEWTLREAFAGDSENHTTSKCAPWGNFTFPEGRKFGEYITVNPSGLGFPSYPPLGVCQENQTRVYVHYLNHPSGYPLEVPLDGSIDGGFFEGTNPSGKPLFLRWRRDKGKWLLADLESNQTASFGGDTSRCSPEGIYNPNPPLGEVEILFTPHGYPPVPPVGSEGPGGSAGSEGSVGIEGSVGPPLF